MNTKDTKGTKLQGRKPESALHNQRRPLVAQAFRRANGRGAALKGCATSNLQLSDGNVCHTGERTCFFRRFSDHKDTEDTKRKGHFFVSFVSFVLKQR